MPLTRPLHVGMNLLYLVEDSGGAGRYARELIRALLEVEPQTRITAWVGNTAPTSLREEPWYGEVDWVRLPVPGVGPPWHLAHQLAGMSVGARRRRIDVVHGLANIVPPLHPGVATVATILDLTWMHFPQSMGWRGRVVNRLLAPLSGRTANRVIAISEAVREDLVATLHLDPARIDVTPLGIRMTELVTPAAADEVRQRFGLGDEPLVLVVAQKRVHKNIAGAIEAVAALPAEVPAQLVVPGSPTAHEDELRALASRLGVADRVHFPAWVSDAELEALYGLAACFLMPSFAEGFGLPLLEAMRRDVPVACSRSSSLPEVAGDAAAYFDPHDPNSIANALRSILVDREYAARLIAAGRARCRELTWTRTAELTLATYRRAIAARS
jgi:glycosyltransferase involved in cell wall biosynthesis